MLALGLRTFQQKPGVLTAAPRAAAFRIAPGTDCARSRCSKRLHSVWHYFAKSFRLITISSLVVAALLGCHKQSGTESEHHHHGEAAAPVAKSGRKFATDANLRLRMVAVLNTMKAIHATGSKVNLAETGANIETTVQDIFKNCNLEPAADAAIHPILADLLKGAELFKKGKQKEGHEIIHNALLRYGNFFDHPGWDH